MIRPAPWTLFSAGAVALAGVLLQSPALQTTTVSPSAQDVACANCHRAIFDRYRATPMAQASGSVHDGMLTGAFRHQPSGVAYRIALENGKALLSFERAASSSAPALSGQRELLAFIGSGHRGRTFLYQQSGLWFEAPINYYSRKGLWDMAPNYATVNAMPDALPVDPNCLHCHATGVQPSLPSARNRFASIPFEQNGIGCSSCHGDPAQHLAHPVKGNILNPDALSASRRDSICLQCHLEADVAIYESGKSLSAFHPGDDLSDFVSYFVKGSAEPGGRRAVSQYEALLRSPCKLRSGDKLNCTTCHDPHGSPPEAQRVAFYRGKCLQCHHDQRIAVKHHPEQPDCALCHMPARVTTDISHEQTTDHNIRARPALTELNLVGLGETSYRLLPVGAFHASDRELGLAYAQAAERGNHEALAQALLLLKRAESAGADDAELHAQLGLMEQIAGHLQRALQEYNEALTLNPANSTALANKAVMDASAGKTIEALHLLERTVENDPSQVSAGLNLAFLQCAMGRKLEALAILQNLQRYNPDNPAVRAFLEQGIYAGKSCALNASAREDRGRAPE